METDPIESLRLKHRQEKKQLQSTIYNLRKSCSKKEKSTLQDRISSLERELKVKQERELDELQMSLSSLAIDVKGVTNYSSGANNNSTDDNIPNSRSEQSDASTSVLSVRPHNKSMNHSEYVGDDEDEDEEGDRQNDNRGCSRVNSSSYSNGLMGIGGRLGGHSQQAKNRGKAQRRREKAEKAHQERMEKQKQQSEAVEKSNKLAESEMSELVGILASRCLQLVQVPADGDCFYHAIHKHLVSEDQSNAESTSCTPTVDDLRIAVSDYLISHESEYAAFFEPSDNNSEAYTFKDYCEKIKSNHEWAGHLEITAMSHHLSRPIEILQATTRPSTLIGQDYTAKHPITLVYHRNMFNCGEHYNLALPNSK